MQKPTTLAEFITERQQDFAYATGELSRLLHDITTAAKIINYEVNRAGLGNILGAHGEQNVQGEDQQKLDVIANDVFMNAFQKGGEVAAVGSEEMDDMVSFPEAKDRKYVVLFDPLDGSSNIDVNVSIGTIFSIFRRKTQVGTPATLEDMLQPGTEQVAAGYVLYGSSTMLVYSTGNGVHGFTLDPSIGEFCLSHPNMRFPEKGKIYSINEGNLAKCDQGVVDYVRWCQEDVKEEGRPYSGRYIGSLVADFHRNLIKGGIYIYPGTTSAPNGKLRLLYECSPLAFLAEHAGGTATDGNRRVLDIVPTELHQRVPYYVGPTSMVKKAMSFETVKSE